MIFVERLDRRGRVRGRVKVDALPFRIGRGYDCDLILDDPHVSPLHAVLERDAEGGLVLRDAGSRNGLFVGASRDPVTRVVPDGDVSVRLGRTVLRLRAVDFAVPEAVPIVRRPPFLEWLLEHWSAALVVPAVFMGILIFEQYRRTTTPFEPARALSASAWSLLVYGIWVGAWALLNRLLRQRTRFVAHSSVAFLVASVYTLLEWGFEWLRFLFAPIEPLRLADLFTTTALWCLVLLGHLTVMGVASRRLRLGVVGVGFCAILGLQLLDRYDEGPDWVVTLPYWSRLEPVDPAWLPVESVDGFFTGLPDLASELDRLAQEAREEAAGAVDPAEPVPEPPSPPVRPAGTG